MTTHHVYPISDIQPHEVDYAFGAGDCQCQPEVEYVHGGYVVTHNAFDLREMFEEDGPFTEPVAAP